MITISGVQFQATVNRPYPVLFSSLTLAGMSDRRNWRGFLTFPYGLKGILVIGGVYYYPYDHLNIMPPKLIKGLFADEKKFLILKKDSLRRERNLIRAVKGDYRKFFQAQRKYMPALALYHICDFWIEKTVREALDKKFTPTQVQEIMTKINVPLTDNFDKKKNLEILKNGVDSFLKKYSWTKFRYYHFGVYPRSEAVKLRRLLKTEKYLDKYKQEKVELRQTIEKVKQALGPKAYYLDIMQFFVYYRTHRTDVFNKTVFDFHPKLVKLAASLGLSYEQVIQCTYQEILSKKIPPLNIINDRIKDHIFLGVANKSEILSGADRAKFIQKYVAKVNGVSEFKGQVVFHGRVRGRVKVICQAADLANFPQGDILVASMTTPHMVFAMKMAAAFITDEGGITCHAAILAREMKKPCIIGTKIATKVLNDGDLVELDANQGLVKILKSSIAT